MQLWARTVEAYSQKALTKPQDRLIALAGFAKLMAKRLDSRYVAGLWETDLEYQLLWYVEPEFNHRTRTFSQKSIVPREYCGPTFSWTAVDVTGYGLIYADLTFRSTYIKVGKCQLELREPTQPFGLLDGACLTIWCKLREATLHTAERGRFCLRLSDRGALDHEPYTNIYLDCYERDKSCIDEHRNTVYVVPAAINMSGDMICLILRQHGPTSGSFQRVGLTKLASYMERDAMFENGHSNYRILETSPLDASLPHAGFDEEKGIHRIHLT